MQRYDIITHNNRSHEVPLRPAPGPRICMCAFACQLCEANALWNLAVSMRSLRCMSHIHKSCARDCRHMCTSSWYRCFMVREHARVRPSTGTCQSLQAPVQGTDLPRNWQLPCTTIIRKGVLFWEGGLVKCARLHNHSHHLGETLQQLR